MVWSLQFLGYLRTLSLKFQKATIKIEVFQSLPCLGWRSQTKQGRDWKNSILLIAFSNFKLEVLKYQWNFRPHATQRAKFAEKVHKSPRGFNASI